MGSTFSDFSGFYLRLANVPECLYCRRKVKWSSFNLINGLFTKIESDYVGITKITYLPGLVWIAYSEILNSKSILLPAGHRASSGPLYMFHCYVGLPPRDNATLGGIDFSCPPTHPNFAKL